MVVEPRLVVGGERHDQRALVAQFHVDAGRLPQLRRECRPARLALAPERDQRLLARLGLAAGCEHPGGGMGRARSGGAAVEHLDRDAARGKPPGDAKPDHAGANDGDLWFVRCVTGGPSRGGSLRWHDPDRFDGCALSRGSAAPQAE